MSGLKLVNENMRLTDRNLYLEQQHRLDREFVEKLKAENKRLREALETVHVMTRTAWDDKEIATLFGIGRVCAKALGGEDGN